VFIVTVIDGSEVRGRRATKEGDEEDFGEHDDVAGVVYWIMMMVCSNLQFIILMIRKAVVCERL